MTSNRMAKRRRHNDDELIMIEEDQFQTEKEQEINLLERSFDSESKRPNTKYNNYNYFVGDKRERWSQRVKISNTVDNLRGNHTDIDEFIAKSHGSYWDVQNEAILCFNVISRFIMNNNFPILSNNHTEQDYDTYGYFTKAIFSSNRYATTKYKMSKNLSFSTESKLEVKYCDDNDLEELVCTTNRANLSLQSEMYINQFYPRDFLLLEEKEPNQILLLNHIQNDPKFYCKSCIKVYSSKDAYRVHLTNVNHVDLPPLRKQPTPNDNI